MDEYPSVVWSELDAPDAGRTVVPDPDRAASDTADGDDGAPHATAAAAAAATNSEAAAAAAAATNSEAAAAATSEVRFGRRFALPAGSDVSGFVMYFVGPQSQALTNLMLYYNHNTFFSFDPVTNLGRQETVSTNKMLMRRSAAGHRTCPHCCTFVLVDVVNAAMLSAVLTHRCYVITACCHHPPCCVIMAC